MINIIKQEITFDEVLLQKLEFICEFSHTTPVFINSSIQLYVSVKSFWVNI